MKGDATCSLKVSGVWVSQVKNGRCQDGGSESESALCTFGTDFPDCPTRQVPAPSSPPPPAPPTSPAPPAPPPRINQDMSVLMTMQDLSGAKALTPVRTPSFPFDPNLLFYEPANAQGTFSYELSVPSNAVVSLQDAFGICGKFCDDMNQSPQLWRSSDGAERNMPGLLETAGAVLCENIQIQDLLAQYVNGLWNCQFYTGQAPLYDAEDPSLVPTYVYRRPFR